MKTRLIASVLASLALATLLVTVAQNGGGDVRIAEHETYGPYLTDAEGQSLYLFLNDAPYTSNCTGDCAENWPPLTTETSPLPGEGVEIVRLGTIEREGGARQITYDGWPLYTFAGDENSGNVAGQGVGEAWYLVSPEGEPIGIEDPAAEDAAAVEGEDAEAGDAEEAAAGAEGEGNGEAAAEGEVSDEVMSAGEAIYEQNCASCHGPQGRGVVGPALAGNQTLADAAATARQIIHGRDEMPPFGGFLDNEQIAAVGTYIRNSWGNSFGPLTEEQAAEQR